MQAYQELLPGVGFSEACLSPQGRYSSKLAQSQEELAEIQGLRLRISDPCSHERFLRNFSTDGAPDLFDPACDHLLVRDHFSGLLVGTHRLQTGKAAKAHHDYCSASRFDLSPLEPYRHRMIEMGWLCVHPAHRNAQVLGQLWRGLAAYLLLHEARFVIACSSMPASDEAEALALFQSLVRRGCMSRREFQTEPWPDHWCKAQGPLQPPPKLPELLSDYLSLGATIGSPPAIDRALGTIDFLSILDIHQLNQQAGYMCFGTLWTELLIEFTDP